MTSLRPTAISAFVLFSWMSAQGAGLRHSDFNGDGYDDLAIGVPRESVGASGYAGAVNVLYGSPVGITAQHDQFWHQGRPGVLDDPETGDYFGNALSMGDYNADGFTDLAIGVSEEGLNGLGDVGAVAILYGSALGLTSVGNQIWSQAAAGVDGVAEAFDIFGTSLASGDFNDDGFEDLAIGVPGESVGGFSHAGAVNILYGSAAGLTSAGSQFWNQDSPGMANEAGGGAAQFELFGRQMTTGDFNGDGIVDLVVGAPGQDYGVDSSGVFHVLFGGGGGLTTNGSQVFSASTSGVPLEPDTAFTVGLSFAPGDFNGDSIDDLAIGMRDHDPQSALGTGRAGIMYGGPAGLSNVGAQFWSQDSPGVNSSIEQGDAFAYRITAGDFDADGHDDLAVGVPFESLPQPNNPHWLKFCGAVNVLYGTDDGLSADDTQFWHENVPGIPNRCESNDRFGNAVTVGDYDGNGVADLVVGVRLEGIPTQGYPYTGGRAGAVIVIYGSSARLTATGSQIWHQNRPGVADACEHEDRFGTLGR